jgi:hypothetical protein
MYMATLRVNVGAAAIIAGSVFLASAAHACDDRLPHTCKPIPGAAAAEPAETAKSGKRSKPLQITTRRRGGSAKSAKATRERAAHVSRKQAARKAASRRSAARARHAAATAAERADVEPARPLGDGLKQAGSGPVELSRHDALPSPSRPARVADGSNDGAPAFASKWKDVTAPATEPFELAAAASRPAAAPSEPAASRPPQPPLSGVSRDEPNEMDLAVGTAPASSDSFWWRGLFLAFGGLLAVGSALRFLV